MDFHALHVNVNVRLHAIFPGYLTQFTNVNYIYGIAGY